MNRWEIRKEIRRTTAGILLFAGVMGMFLAPRTVSAQEARALLESRLDFPVGELPLGVFVADLDGDRNLDVVTINQSSDNISIVKGFGDGTLRQIALVPTGLRPSGAVLVDADGDGVDDLVVSTLIGRSIFVHPGDGLGGFGAPFSSPTGTSPSGLAVGDWDGNGTLDVATVNSNSNSITRMFGDGNGLFTTALQIGAGAAPKAIVAADLNGDGPLDLAIVNSVSNTLQVFRGDGSGQFNLANTLATGAGPLALIAADLNNDTLPDLASANNAGDTVTIYLADGSGGYTGPTTLSPGFGPRGLAVADLDGDTDVDMIIALSKIVGVGEVVVMAGDGSGSFSVPVKLHSGPVPNSVAVGDFNEDGLPDLVTSNRIGNSISVIPGVGTGTFLEPTAIDLPVGTFPHGLVIADFNSDENPDVASANSASNNISVASGDGAGGFTSVNSANNVGITPFAVAALDFNLDLDIDLVSANNGDESLSYLQGSGSGNFTVTNGIASGCEAGVVALSVGDISGDGIDDLAVACEVSNEICTRRGTGGTGASAFGAAVCSPAGQTPSGIAVGFFNLDAFEDIAWSVSGQAVLQVAISDGAGGFLDIPTDFPVGLEPKGVLAGDLNGDGFLDLVVANSGSGSVSAMLGDGGGIFSFPSIESPAGKAPTALAMADFNLDGIPDVAVTNTNGNNVSLLLGDGFGRFSNAGDFGTRDLPISIGAGDFNLDGRPDLAVADNFSDTISILLNLSIPGDPLAMFSVFGTAEQMIFRWGLVPGAVYDLIRGDANMVTEGPATFDLGPVTCVANDLVNTDTAEIPATDLPAVGTVYFYVVRAVVGGIAGDYTVSSNGKPGAPSSGGCP